MTSIQWATYGLPVVAGVLALAGFLYLRHSAAEFDRKYGDKLHPGE